MIMSMPGAMPSVSRPRTLAENGSALVPRSTVYPVPVSPSTASAVGSTVGQSVAAAIDEVAGSATSRPETAAVAMKPQAARDLVMVPPLVRNPCPHERAGDA
jgi:hypothetical protein